MKMKWIKASEFKHTPFTTIYLRGHGFKSSGYFTEDGELIWHCKITGHNIGNNLEDLEILDESAPEPEGKEAVELWNDVKKPPEESGLVLVSVAPTGDIYVSFYRTDRRLFEVWGAGRDPIIDMKVTHWRELPEKPDIWKEPVE